MVPIPESGEEPLVPEAKLKNMVIPYLSLDEAAGSSGQVLATQAVTSVGGGKHSFFTNIFHLYIVFTALSSLHLQFSPAEHSQSPSI